jgi:putative ABC transport system permease protein
VVENLLLAGLGGALGLLLAAWGAGLLASLSPGNIPRLQEVGLDGRVLGFTALVSVAVGLVFGLMPARQAAKLDLSSQLKGGGRTTGAQASPGRLRDALVVTEVALALVLLVGAGLLVRSFLRLGQVNAGFETERLLTMRLYPPASGYRDQAEVAGLYERLLERVGSLPGVRGAAAAGSLPIGGGNSDTMMEIEGRPFDISGLNLSVDFRVVMPEYFPVMGVRLVRGRYLTMADREDAAPAVVVNETLARTHWPGEDPVGRRVRLLDAPPAEATTSFMTIVGVVADAKNRGLDRETRQEMYVPLRQNAAAVGSMGTERPMTLLVRTSGEPASVASAARREVWEVDRGIAIGAVRTMEEVLEEAVVQPRFYMLLLVIFAVAALGLGAVGIYGLMSYSVTQRTHEIGVRVALGASPADVLRLVVRRGMALTFAGVAIGLAGALGLSWLMRSLLFGVSAADPATFAGVGLLLPAVALLACYIPARRAARVDPLVALRQE